MLVFTDGNVPIKAWIDGVAMDENAKQQLINLAKMPFVFKHVAVMPDVHLGIGCSIGTVIATQGAIIPAAVGVDIGCGMIAVKTPLCANDLPDNLHKIRTKIEAAVPHGRTNDGGSGDRGAWHDVPHNNISTFNNSLITDYSSLLNKHPILNTRTHPVHHLGTLGTGNHFIELCIDQNKDVWVMLHSGSRGIGNKIGTYFIEKAKEEMRKYYIDKFIPDMDLAYLVEHTELYNDYMDGVGWAQKFASLNRMLMLHAVLDILKDEFPMKFLSPHSFSVDAINCHHNYVTKEHHFNKNVLITRKGAVRAKKDELGIIPGSMGAKSFIVRGKGNCDSFHSCSHGAGRVMSRGEAKKLITLEDHAHATQGVECRKDEEVLDESPAAYKDIDKVMKAQEDLVEIVYTLKQVLCVKG